MAKAAHAAIATLHRKPIPANSPLKGLWIHDVGICLKWKMREAFQGRIPLGAPPFIKLQTAGAVCYEGLKSR